jgi:hypothetical protein
MTKAEARANSTQLMSDPVAARLEPPPPLVSGLPGLSPPGGVGTVVGGAGTALTSTDAVVVPLTPFTVNEMVAIPGCAEVRIAV